MQFVGKVLCSATEGNHALHELVRAALHEVHEDAPGELLCQLHASLRRELRALGLLLLRAGSRAELEQGLVLTKLASKSALESLLSVGGLVELVGRDSQGLGHLPVLCDEAGSFWQGRRDAAQGVGQHDPFPVDLLGLLGVVKPCAR